MPPDALQLVVVDRAGRQLGRVDLAWRLPDGTWLLVEIDGAEIHSTPQAVYRDRSRQNALMSTGGARLLRFTAGDIRSRMVTTLSPMLSAAGWSPGHYDDHGEPVTLGSGVRRPLSLNEA